MDFLCNVCGKQNTGVEVFGREVQNCSGCLSTVRIRALVYALSLELYGTPLQLRDFPVLKGLRSLGMTDSDSYAKWLAEKFDYKNTFFDREPKLDITNINASDEGAFDLLISSEVFEHVRPPIEKALDNAFRLLGPHGVLILTVPYAPDDRPSIEHFPQLADATLAHLRSGPVLVNRTIEGELQVFDQLVFHGGSGSTLEMRVLNEAALRRALLDAGFTHLEFYADDYAPFGIHHTESWSLPLAARKQPFELGAPLRAELLQQFGELHHLLRRAHAEIQQQQAEIRRQQAENTALNQDLEAKAEWAKALDQDIHEARSTIERLEAEVVKRTEWAQSLDRELTERTRWGTGLETEVESRTKWAQDLERLLEERTQWALQLDARGKKLESELSALRATWWNRVGRLLRVVG